jgi:phage terminase large subunit-like protein
MFSQGLIYAPERDWSELAITEMSMFPAGRYDDLTDSATQALKYLRDVGLANTDEEERQAEIETVMRYRRPLPPPYPC